MMVAESHAPTPRVRFPCKAVAIGIRQRWLARCQRARPPSLYRRRDDMEFCTKPHLPHSESRPSHQRTPHLTAVETSRSRVAKARSEKFDRGRAVQDDSPLGLLQVRYARQL